MRGKEECKNVLHQHPNPVQHGPVQQVVMATMPETHKPKRQRCGDEFPEHTVTRAAQWHIYVPKDTQTHMLNKNMNYYVENKSCCFLLKTNLTINNQKFL